MASLHGEYCFLYFAGLSINFDEFKGVFDTS